MFFHYLNLGCKVNQIESEKIAQDLDSLGYTYKPKVGESDFIVINTCTVTEKADKKSLHTIKKMSQLANCQKVFVTGCYSELEKDLKNKLNNKCFIISQRNKNQAKDIIDQELRNHFHYNQHIPNYKNKWEAFKSSRIFVPSLNNSQQDFIHFKRAFIKVQDGCNAFCSYCRIPFSRGAPVSRDYNDILRQVVDLDKKKNEIVLTGINIGTYFDKKNKINFARLVKGILNSCKKAQLRISSLEPQSIKKDFLELVGHRNLIPHFHLPLQGLSNRILSEMKRRYTLEEFYELIKFIRRSNPHFAISTDIITGFPGESDEEFEAGVRFIKKCNISKIHAFPFSFRPLSELEEKRTQNKLAYPPTPKSIIKTRVEKLNRLSGELIDRQAHTLKDICQNFILEEKVNPLNLREYQKILPFSFPLEKYDFFRGTSNYYLKGILATRKDEAKLGERLTVKINSLNPIVFSLNAD